MSDLSKYPPEWPAKSKEIKEKAGNKCERCGAANSRVGWRILTVHHLDGNKANLEDWNLAALCQRCHLSVQGRVKFLQDYIFEHTPWMLRHVLGYNVWASKNRKPLLTVAKTPQEAT